jgi:acetylornithine deacetylase/succinyl-diaminopimelate desuccinylase-like protein
VHQSRRMQLTFGVRGAFDLEMTTYGPLRGLHSGHYGNWAPNPAMELAHILAGMRDTDGRILISGFARHVRPLSEAERAALDQVPAVEEQLQHDFGLGRVEKVRPRLVDAITMPAINLRGIRSAYVGEQAANAIPTEAQASFDFRLVPDLLPQHVRELVEAHLRKRGYHIVHDTPDASTRRAHPRLVKLQWGSGYAGYRTSMDLPASQAVIQVVEQALGAPAVKLPNAGGSLPLYLFDEVLRTPLLIVPIVNHDNSQHAADENLRLQNLWDGIEIYAALFARLGAEWE